LAGGISWLTLSAAVAGGALGMTWPQRAAGSESPWGHSVSLGSLN
jgi:hypothetical protein